MFSQYFFISCVKINHFADMKNITLHILTLVICVSASAQMTPQTTNSVMGSAELKPFKTVDINAPMVVRMIGVEPDKPCRIEYDLKGATDSKFDFSVNDSTLYIREKVSLRRTTTSEAVIYYHSLESLTALRANINIDSALTSQMVDIKLQSEASLVAKVNCQDLRLMASGRSVVSLSGASTYISLVASSGSTAVVRDVECRAAWVDASHGATVEVRSWERMEIKSIVGAVVRYLGEPTIIRTEKSVIGGEILKIQNEQ